MTKYQHNTSDTGSTEVQVALFTAKINSLAKHLKKHGKDSDSKRGLIIMVGKRRRLLNYLLKHNQAQYQKLIADLGLRK
ncbi:30S ribosomal protein S15 [Candidatus Berkelbacteria bacterium CG2_30_43_20]|nr:MAG: 30S ribosomal protein S15 [Candidatus Berkelbacteria bacterium CG2_30_43_20]